MTRPSTKLKFFWQASEDQLKHLRRLAAVTGHQSIRDLFGTLVTEGLKVLEKGLQEELARIQAEAVKPGAERADESNVQHDTADAEAK